jgi:hypothetical protein
MANTLVEKGESTPKKRKLDEEDGKECKHILSWQKSIHRGS